MSLTRTHKVTQRNSPPNDTTSAVEASSTGTGSSSISEECYLFAFGDNSSGQLLMSTDSLSVCKPSRVTKFAHNKVEFLACGCANSFVLSEAGDVWAGGLNDLGQVALATDEDGLDKQRTIGRPCKLERLCNRAVKHVMAGPEHAVAVLDNGAAISYGTNEYGQLGQGDEAVSLHPRAPGAVKSLTHRGGVAVSACGRSFTLFLTKWGEVWACGDNGSGCLGVPGLPSTAVPVRIPGLAGSPVVQIAAGDEHCLALSLSGTLYGWGRAHSGQLGLGRHVACEEKIVAAPRVIACLPGKPKRICAGGSHSILILSEGRVAASGLNTSGQCGQTPNEDKKVFSFELIPSLPRDLRWLMASAGTAHSVLVSASGDVYTFGRNLEGQLGLGRLTPFESEPQRAELTPEDSTLFAYGAAAGDFHTLVAALPLAIDGQIVNALVRQHSVTRSGANSPVREPLSLPEIPLFRVASEVKPSRASKRLRVGQIESISKILKTTSVDCMSALLPVESTPSPKPPTPKGYKVGYKADELIHLLDQADQESSFDIFKSDLRALFSNAARLNCSFLISSRTPELDVLGLESFYTKLSESSKYPIGSPRGSEVSNELLAVLLSAMGACVSDMLPVAGHLCQSDQVRFVLICLHCPVFEMQPLPNAVGKVLSSLYGIVAGMPCAGRAHLFSTITSSYPPREFQTRLVDPARRHVAWLLPRNVGRTLPAVEDLWSLMLFLQLLYLANETVASQTRFDEATSRRLGKLPPEAFAIAFPQVRAIDPAAELRVLLSLAQSEKTEWKFEPRSVLREEGPIDGIYRFFFAHTNLLPLSFKQEVVRYEAYMRQAAALPRIAVLTSAGWQRTGFFTLTVRRESLVSDAVHQIVGCSGHELMRPLKVIFQGEEGVDEGGLTREFFRLAINQLFSPEYGMFRYDSESRSVWFTPCVIEGQTAEFAVVGTLLGLAIYNDVLLDLKLAPPTYAKLLDLPTSFEDLADVNKARAEGLKKMLDIDCSTPEGRQLFDDAFGMMTMVETLDYFGETREIPLKEGGDEITLTPENREEYAELVADFILNKSVEPAFEPFKRGFLMLCRSALLKALRPRELQLLLTGEQNLDFEELKQGARYEGGFHPDHPYIKWFWEILTQEWTLLEKQKFLYFATGSDRAPIGGLRELKLLVQRNGAEPTDRLPTALTCFNALLLPEYESKDKLSRLLKTAIDWGEGFGLK